MNSSMYPIGCSYVVQVNGKEGVGSEGDDIIGRPEVCSRRTVVEFERQVNKDW